MDGLKVSADGSIGEGARSPREVARINPDGTYSVTNDISLEEMGKCFYPLLKVAANLLRQKNECERSHKA